MEELEIVLEVEDDEELSIDVLEEDTEKVFPTLENLEVNPSSEKQIFNHPNSYGYDEVVVNAITGDTLEIVPSKEEQSFSGVYTEVKAKGVTSEVDENIKPENIKGGVEILGVEGSFEAIDYWSTEKDTNSKLDLKYYLKEVPKNIDVSNKTSFDGLFEYCKKLEKADLSNWNTENVTKLSYLFSSCDNLKEVNVSGLNTSKVTTLNSLFSRCSNLTDIDVNSWDTSNVTGMNSTFGNCKKLKSLDLSNWDTTKVTDMSTMFWYCQSLEYLDIRNFTFDNVTTYNMVFDSIPNNCEIIVKDDTAKAWVLARNSKLTNVKTVAEL